MLDLFHFFHWQHLTRIAVVAMCFVEWHEKGFIVFVLSAEIYMITTIVLCRLRRSLPDFSTTVNTISFSSHCAPLIANCKIIVQVLQYGMETVALCGSRGCK